MEAQKEFFEKLYRCYGMKNMDDWYSIHANKVQREEGGVALLCRYGNSLSRALESVYPQHEWKPWLFLETPKGFWNDIKNQREFLDWLFKKLELKDWSDWYNVPVNTVRDLGGAGLLYYYNNSIAKALQVAYPEFRWDSGSFSRHSRGHWENLESHQKQLESVEKSLGIKTKEDWYQVKKEDMAKLGAEGFLKYHNSSLPKALENIYKDHSWTPWKFSNTPKNYWDDPEHVKQYINWLENELNIVKPQDWYKISYKQVSVLGGNNLLKQYGGFINVLTQVYPNVPWDPKFFARGGNWGKSQWSLYLIAQNLFPNVLVHIDYPHPRLRWPNGNQRMQLDIFIPDLNLAFEYQGVHHYEFTWLLGDPVKFKKRDEEKRESCLREGITLIEIPYWWQNTEHEIRATVHKYRPDLMPDPGKGIPIPDTPPAKRDSPEV